MGKTVTLTLDFDLKKHLKALKKRFRLNLKGNWFVPVCVALLLILGASAVVVYKSKNASKSYQYVYDCNPSDPQSLECEQQKYVNIFKKDGVTATFAQLKQAYQTDASIQTNCHQIAHAIGRQAAVEYKTIANTFRHGNNFCWDGYYHGAMEEFARTEGSEKLNTILTTVCSSFEQGSEKYGLDDYNCVHALGHGLMAVNDDNVFTSLKLCDKFTDSWYRSSCYGGVFMENSILGYEGGANKFLKASDPMYPCDAIAARYKSDCYDMQTSNALTDIGYKDNDYSNYKKVFELCGEQGKYASNCWQSLGRDVSGNTISNIDQTKQLCMLGQSTQAVEDCFTGASDDYVMEFTSGTRAKELCNALPSEYSAACNKQLTYFLSYAIKN